MLLIIIHELHFCIALGLLQSMQQRLTNAKISRAGWWSWLNCGNVSNCPLQFCTFHLRVYDQSLHVMLTLQRLVRIMAWYNLMALQAALNSQVTVDL